MRTGIFVACVGRQHAGPETYERKLLQGIARVDQDNEYVVGVLGSGAADGLGIDQPNVRFVPLPASRWVSVPAALPAMLLRQGVSRFHATFVPPPLTHARYLFTQHDVSPFVHPEFYPRAIGVRLRFLIRRGLARAALIHCISHHALETTAELLRVPRDRMAVVHHGVDPVFRPRDPEALAPVLRSRYGIEWPYVLYAGKLESRKNIVRQLEAFHAFKQETGAPHRFVLAGNRFWAMDGIDETLARLRLREQVVEIGHVEHERLAELYAGAEAFLFPTLWEGFGLPVLEAMACGAPVITSRVSCLPEIAGDGAELVDPYRADEIAAALVRICTDRAHRADLSRRARARAGEFSWDRTARETIALYERLQAL